MNQELYFYIGFLYRIFKYYIYQHEKIFTDVNVLRGRRPKQI